MNNLKQNSEEKFLKIFDFKKSYENKIIFDYISYLCFESGKIYALLAPNGSGKSTLMKCICYLITEYEGFILYEDKKTQESFLVDSSFNGEIVYSPATPSFDELKIKVIDYLRLTCLLKNSSDKKVDFDVVLKDFLSYSIFRKKKNIFCNNLSTGEKKIFSFFLSNITKPKVIVLDEPLNGLDHSWREFVIKKINDFKKERRIVILSTHVFNDINGLVDEILIIKDKKILVYNNFSDVTKIYEEIYPPENL